jgi:hypothetical protein
MCLKSNSLALYRGISPSNISTSKKKAPVGYSGGKGKKGRRVLRQMNDNPAGAIIFKGLPKDQR